MNDHIIEMTFVKYVRIYMKDRSLITLKTLVTLLVSLNMDCKTLMQIEQTIERELGRGGGVYSYIHDLPDGFLFKSTLN